MKILPKRDAFFHADRPIDTLELIVAFLYFADPLKPTLAHANTVETSAFLKQLHKSVRDLYVLTTLYETYEI